MKKTFILVYMAVISIGQITAQQVCHTFDDQAIGSQEITHSFNLYGDGASGFLQDWYVTSGTPGIYPNNQLAGVSAYEGTQYALMGVCDISGNWSEGLSLSYDFLQGHNYTVTLAIRNAPLPPNSPTPIDISFILLEDTIPFNYQFNTGCTSTPSVPSGAVTAHSISDFDNNSWQLVSFDVTNLNQDFSQLWFRATRANGAAQVTTFFLLDMVCVEEILPSACFTFDEEVVSVQESAHAFNLFGDGASGFLEDWYVTSGTPAIYSSNQLAGVGAYDGDQFMMCGVCDISGDWSEGVSLSYDFQQGQSYSISMAVRNAPLPPNSPTPIDINFILLEDTIPFNYQFNSGCTATPTIPLSATTAHSVPSFNTNAWTLVSFDVNNLSNDYTQLWFRPTRSSGSPQITTFFLMDSLCITQTSNVAVNDLAHSIPMSVYPNPSNGIFTLKVENEEALNIRIMDVSGKTIRTEKLAGSTHYSIYMQDAPIGVYVMEIETNQGRSFKKLVKN